MTALSRVTDFLYREADCLDRGDLDAWIELYAEDGTFWMPVSAEQTDPNQHISLFYDDRTMMEIRRRNFGHALAASMEYPVRCSHMIGNVRIANQSENSFNVHSNFQAVVYYKEQQTLYAGSYTHELLEVNGEFKISHKRVDLINADAEHGSLIIYL
ncbi:MAG: aromatic-ring-hydroxylating dioxygenase subunit beta [Pseudomonadota bacterium]